MLATVAPVATRAPQRAPRFRVGGALLAVVVAACSGDPGEPSPGPPPSGLGYSVNPAAYTVGLTIPPNAPSSSGGAVVSYAVAPALPEGLSLDTSTGVISGTPAALAAPASYTVTATNPAGSAAVSLGITVDRLNAIAVTPADRAISLGQSTRYLATAAYELAGERDVSWLATWSSLDPSVATVEEGGLARSAAEGTTTISASLAGATGTASLTVGPVSLESLTILNGDVIDIPADGRTVQLRLAAVSSDGSTTEVTELARWSSAFGFVAVSDTPGTKGLVSTVELGDDVVEAAYLGMTARVYITVY